MGHKVYAGDWMAHHTKMIQEGQKFDRIIADIPSFLNRWSGSQGPIGLGQINDLVSATIVMAEQGLSEDGTMTISCTGVAQERFDVWFNQQSDWELVPNSTWAMFRPYMRKVSENKHFWGRRDDWTFVRSYRKVGSSYTINPAGWPGSTRHVNNFDNFPMPTSMNDVELSAFRAPYHKGEHEAKEKQKWLSKMGITYEEIEHSNGTKVVTAIGSDAHFTEGYIVQLSSDPADWVHIPKRVGQHGDYFTNEIIGKFNDNTLKGVRNLQGGNHKHVMLSSWILHTHTNEGDRVLDPFCGFGSMGAACAIMKRDFTGVEMNPTRANIAQNAYDELRGVIAQDG